jgi:hypothetical protein
MDWRPNKRRIIIALLLGAGFALVSWGLHAYRLRQSLANGALLEVMSTQGVLMSCTGDATTNQIHECAIAPGHSLTEVMQAIQDQMSVEYKVDCRTEVLTCKQL